MRKLFASIVLLLALLPSANAQRQNTFYVDQFQGDNVGQKTNKAQAACLADTNVPCVIIFDTVLAVWPVGSLPTQCGNCTWIDWRVPGSLAINTSVTTSASVLRINDPGAGTRFNNLAGSSGIVDFYSGGGTPAKVCGISAVGTLNGTCAPTLTLKKGTGAGNYTGVNTAFADVDAVNLSLTVTIPTGWKLSVVATFNAFQSTAAAAMQFALFDSAILVVQDVSASAININQPVTLATVVTGDGLSHTVKIQADTSNAADAWNISNSSATRTPTIIYTLSPSN